MRSRPSGVLLLIGIAALAGLACSTANNGATSTNADAGTADAPVATPAPDGSAGSAPVDLQQCLAEHARAWQVAAPACAGKRTCVDPRGRFWVDGKPFFMRGVYNGGWEYTKVVGTCPAGAPCQAWNPKDARAFVRMLADAGFNVIQERSRYNAPVLDAVHAEPRMRFAHLLWSDPFTKDGHDAMEADIRAAADDPTVIMWFGPDEIDLNDDHATAAGIRRILRGASPGTNQLLQDYPPKAGASAFVPADQGATDPLGLPYAAALAFDRGLAVGARFYDVMMPITYPFTKTVTAANEGTWGTWRTGKHASTMAVMPILQMVGIPEMSLTQPTAPQVRAQIASSIANGAVSAFYFTMTGDNPKLAGRSGWFAGDDREAWAAFTEMHALEDALVPVMFGRATETAHVGKGEALEWRTWRQGNGQSVTLLVNPRNVEVDADLGAISGAPTGGRLRRWGDCSPIPSEAVLTLGAYEVVVIEAVPGQ